MSDTIVPRPGVRGSLDLLVELDGVREFTTKQLGVIESKMNSKYAEPEPGRVLTFSVDIPDQGFMIDMLTIKTSASQLPDYIIEDIVGMLKETIGDVVDGWEVQAATRRKPMAVDFL